MVIIRNGIGDILSSYSGSVECVDSNGAEVYPILMGCRHLSDLPAHNATIEGDSFSSIQWGSGNSKNLGG